MSDSISSRPPVTVLSGFLGAGKTTLLRHLLAQSEGRRWAAIVNDVAAINIDAQLVAGAGAQRVVELGNGCVCCSVRDELAETIAELAAGGKFERIVVETTGVAEPRAIADLFVRPNAFGRSLSDFASLEALVSVVDPHGFLATRAKTLAAPALSAGAKKPVFELMLDQVECADVVVVNKCDLASPAELEQADEILRGLNPRAEILRTERGQVASEALLGRPRFDPTATLGAARWIKVLNQPPAALAVFPGMGGTPALSGRHETEYGIDSFMFTARRPFRREKILAWLERGLPKGLLRAKGFFWLAEQPADIAFLSIAGGTVRWEFIGPWAATLVERRVINKSEVPSSARTKWQEPHGDRRQELVFIGTELDEPVLRAALQDCLAEFSA